VARAMTSKDDRDVSAFEVVADAHPHRAVHTETFDLCRRHPSDFARLVARRQRSPGRAADEDDRELLPYLVVARVVDHVTRVGVDADRTDDLAVEAGFLSCLTDRRLPYGLAEVDRAAWQCPVVVVGAADQQD